MADLMPKTRGYRAIPRQGMTKWSVIHDVNGLPVTIVDFHSYPAAMAEASRLNASSVETYAAPVEKKVKVLA